MLTRPATARRAPPDIARTSASRGPRRPAARTVTPIVSAASRCVTSRAPADVPTACAASTGNSASAVTCSVYSVNGIAPTAASGHTSSGAARASSSITPSTMSAVPVVCARSNGVPVCGASTASHHQVSVGTVPYRRSARSEPST